MCKSQAFLSGKKSYRLIPECAGVLSTPKRSQNVKKCLVTPAAQLAIRLVLADPPRMMVLDSAFIVGWVVFWWFTWGQPGFCEAPGSFRWCWAPNSSSETQLMGNIILLRLGEQQWRDANLRRISTEMGHDSFMFRKLLCDPAGWVLEMQGISNMH